MRTRIHTVLFTEEEKKGDLYCYDTIYVNTMSVWALR
jgi:hypothetical protein